MAEKKMIDWSGSVSPLRNYLTLIVAFAIVVCISVGVALAFAAASLQTSQVWVLIGFIIIFPFFGLTVISWLVLRHAKKLDVGRNDQELETGGDR